MVTETSRQQPSGFGTFVWALFYFFLFTLLVFFWVRGSGRKEGYEDTRAAERAKVREELVSAAKAKLTSAGIVDEAKGIAHIPIADAKKAIVSELKNKKVAASQVKVDPWLPMPPPADPNAAEPPPPALPSAPQGADTVRFETAQPATK